MKRRNKTELKSQKKHFEVYQILNYLTFEYFFKLDSELNLGIGHLCLPWFVTTLIHLEDDGRVELTLLLLVRPRPMKEKGSSVRDRVMVVNLFGIPPREARNSQFCHTLLMSTQKSRRNRSLSLHSKGEKFRKSLVEEKTSRGR